VLLCNSLISPSDFTAATILDKFKNDAAAQSVERVLKKLSSQKAAEILAVRDGYLSYPAPITDIRRTRVVNPAYRHLHSSRPILPRSVHVCFDNRAGSSSS
jgi:hypothetical protein